MSRIKHNPWGLFLLLLVGAPFCMAAGGKVDQRVVPLPILELEEVLTSWWTRAGFEVQHSKLTDGRNRLRMSRDEADCQFDLSPRSAIAVNVETTITNDSGDISAVVEKWWRYLSLYLQDGPATATPANGQTLPVEVLSRIESVVCLRVTSEEENDSFSGLIVDPDGLVISTAHGIPKNQKIEVILYDGRQLKGILLYQNSAQDLALIQIQGTAFQAASVVDGRNLLGMGENVYAIGCVGDLQGTVTAGTINAPPRRVDDQSLWQVHMEILPGNSGSPVFDGQGAFVALVKGRYRDVSSVGFLIPLETIIHFLKESSPL